LVLCDDVVVHHARDKHTLNGLIGGIAVPQFPGLAGPYVAYVRLSNVHSNELVTVGLEHDDGTKLWELEARLLNNNDPLLVHTLIARIPYFQVLVGGRHLLVARHNHVPVAQMPIQIVGPSESQKD